jgi:plastocyanin
MLEGVRPRSGGAWRLRLGLGLAAALAPLAMAQAADLMVTVVTPAGRPVADAVVMLRPAAGAAPPARPAEPLVIEQRNMQFRPFVLVVPVGAEVAFPNRDPFRHHVYSFSPAKTFELKLYGHDETRTVRFDRPGVVALGCNIHDDMSGFVRVVDTPYAAKTDARGVVVIRNLPAGRASLAAWHPYLKGGRDLTRDVAVPATGGETVKLVLDLKAAPMRRGDY